MRTGGFYMFEIRALVLLMMASLVATACGQPPPSVEQVETTAPTLPSLGLDDTIATLEFRAGPGGTFEVVLQSPAGPSRTLRVIGTEWRLEGILADGEFSLDRISTRDASEYAEAYYFNSGYRWDLQPELHHDGRLLASSAYMPIADQARYSVRITQNGLITRPLNASAARATQENWN